MVGRRAGWRCEYCLARQDVSGYTFHLEHIVPSTRGGANDAVNRALACSPCNLAKGEKTHAADPLTARLLPLFDPRRHSWKAHFVADVQRGLVLGFTEIGRATVDALGMNDAGRVATRQLWAAVGWWP